MSKLTRIAPEVPAADLNAALDYYGRKLGFQTAMVMPDGQYAIVERDDIAIHLFQSPTLPVTPIGLHLFTAGIDDLHQELLHNGAHIVEGVVARPWGNRDFRVADPSGNELKFTEESPI
jgi:uncharacterized glyoxalase superfamily protein PhnB